MLPSFPVSFCLTACCLCGLAPTPRPVSSWITDQLDRSFFLSPSCSPLHRVLERISLSRQILHHTADLRLGCAPGLMQILRGGQRGNKGPSPRGRGGRQAKGPRQFATNTRGSWNVDGQWGVSIDVMCKINDRSCPCHAPYLTLCAYHCRCRCQKNQVPSNAGWL